MCGYFCLAMLYALHTGMSFPEVGQLKFDQDQLDQWLLACVESRTMTMPVLLREGGVVAKSRMISPAEPLNIFHTWTAGSPSKSPSTVVPTPAQTSKEVPTSEVAPISDGGPTSPQPPGRAAANL